MLIQYYRRSRNLGPRLQRPTKGPKDLDSNQAKKKYRRQAWRDWRKSMKISRKHSGSFQGDMNRKVHRSVTEWAELLSHAMYHDYRHLLRIRTSLRAVDTTDGRTLCRKSLADKRPSFHVRFRCNLFRVPPRRANTDTPSGRSVYQQNKTSQNTKPLSDNSEQFSVAGSEHDKYEYTSLWCNNRYML